eukprot:augustus_masked-scaffold_76-processed-gene-0.80-mRNA-1 protein AED:1.00 eAED:1.00 QI:0/0/0/0/1/1/3/0/425
MTQNNQEPNNTDQNSSTQNTQTQNSVSFVALKIVNEKQELHKSFILDSGAPEHLCGDRNLFKTIEMCQPLKVVTVNGTINCSQKGKVGFTTHDGTKIEIQNVYFHDGIPNLISVARLIGKDFIVIFENDNCVIEKPETNFTIHIPVFNGVAEMTFSESIAITASEKTWHTRLNHIAESSISKLPGKVEGLKIGKDTELCEECIKGKFDRSKMQHSNSERVRTPFELLVADSIGTLEQKFHRVSSVNGGGVYYLNEEDRELLLVVYVDDLAYSSDTEESITWLEDKLKNKFKIRCTGLTDKFVGLEMAQENQILWLHHKSKILKIAEEYNLKAEEDTGVVTPMIENPEVPQGNEIEIRKLHKLVGELSYIANHSQPDISFAVNFLVRNISTAKLGLFRMGRRILRYLVNTIHMGIKIERYQNYKLW